MRPDLMLAAATAARNRWALPLAERLARAAGEAGSVFDAHLLLGQLCLLQGRSAEAERILKDLVPQASDDGQRALLASTRMDVLSLGLDQMAEATRVGEEAEATISDVACRDEVTTKRAQLMLHSGHRSTAFELVEPILDRAEGRTLVSAAIMGATCLLLTGRLTDAIETTKRGLAAHMSLAGPPPTLAPQFHVDLHSLALLHAGLLREAEELLTDAYHRGVTDGSLETQGTASLWLARTLLARGRVTAAAHIAQEAAGIYRESSLPTFLRLALTALAHAQALAGSATQARVALAELDGLSNAPGDVFWRPDVLQARAWVEVASGNLSVGHGLLEEAVAMTQESGDLIFEAAALHDLARLGQAGAVADRLGELALIVEGTLTPTRAAHALAQAQGDAEGLQRASYAFEAMGADLLAAEAAASASVIHQRAGDRRRAVALQRRASSMAERCEGATTPALRVIETHALLSPRELEVANLAASGLSNKDIATRLHVSVRTVENQLQRAYEKLGVDGRTELAQALNG
jgi:DNA-binding CsgD family transcriptional regulator